MALSPGLRSLAGRRAAPSRLASLRPAEASGERGIIPLDKRHLPTGSVSLAAFVRMLIAEFGVEPLARDWQARLTER